MFEKNKNDEFPVVMTKNPYKPMSIKVESRSVLSRWSEDGYEFIKCDNVPTYKRKIVGEIGEWEQTTN